MTSSSSDSSSSDSAQSDELEEEDEGGPSDLEKAEAIFGAASSSKKMNTPKTMSKKMQLIKQLRSEVKEGIAAAKAEKREKREKKKEKKEKSKKPPKKQKKQN